MDDVKKEIISKTNNLYNLKHSRDILNSLFNLFDYQISLINQIILFNQSINQKNNNFDYISPNKDYNYRFNKRITETNNLNHLINLNKDIMVSMIMKFLSKINILISKYKNKLNDTQKYLRNDFESLFNSKNFLMNNTYNIDETKYKYKTPKKNIDLISSKAKLKKVNSAKIINLDSNNTDNLNNNFINNTIPSYNKTRINNLNKVNNNNKITKIGKFKKDINNKYNKSNKNERKKNLSLNEPYFINKNDFYIDLNNNNMKTLFNMPIFHNTSLTTKIFN